MHVDHYPITFPPNAALEDIRYTECFADLAQVLLGDIAKLHHRRTADDPEVFDLCQAGEDVVLNAVREKCVVFVRAEVLEGQYRDGFLQYKRRYFRLLEIEPNAKAGDGNQESSGRDQHIFAWRDR